MNNDDAFGPSMHRESKMTLLVRACIATRKKNDIGKSSKQTRMRFQQRVWSF